MKILFFSDVHGYVDGIKKIQEIDKQEQFDKIVSLGDMYYPGPNYDGTKPINCLEVKNIFMGFADRLVGVRGNCDADVDVKASDFPIASELLTFSVDGLDIYCSHGNVYNKENNSKFAGKKGLFVFGHKHVPEIETIDEMVYVNVGSVSVPKNNSKESYAVYEDKKITVYSLDGEVLFSENL